jgi:nicotinamide mononucleotide transporter
MISFTELFGALSGIVYVLLEIRQNRYMWIVGGVSALIYIVIFAGSSLFASAGLQAWYVGASIYGWIAWKRDSVERGSDAPVVVQPEKKDLILSSIVALAGTYLLWYLLANFSEDPIPAFDAVIVSSSMLATYWVAKKYILHWLLWIVTDAFAMVVYAYIGLYATSFLYFVYGVAAVAGFYSWRKFPRVLE